MADIQYESGTKTVLDLINLHKNGHLELSPGFQRDSVWTESDRRQLIESIVRGYPLPSIFLYQRESDGDPVYDVIDGKQRIESILMFVGQLRGRRFSAKVQLPDEEEANWIDWSTLSRRKQQHLITGYKLQTIEVRGELGDIISLFVRINSTGKALTSAEKRHAHYYNSEFLKVASKLADQYETRLVGNKVLSKGQITRMKHVELMCELMLSIYKNDVINKKAALDRVMGSRDLTQTQITKARAKTISAINRLFKLFPHLRNTRFHQLSDFYSLVCLVAKFEAENLILTDRRRNQLASDLLVALSNGVDTVRDLLKKGRNLKREQELYRDYLLTVQQASDEISQRRKREQILRGLLESLFERKDSNRLFSQEQRRLLWNSSSSRKCTECGRTLTWEDFTIDHITPHSKGGRTRLDNAALMCKKHNSSKGNRR